MTFTAPPAAEPDPSVMRAVEVARLSAELKELDAASVRALRAVAAGVATADDWSRLHYIETHAATLRAELSAVVAVQNGV